MPPNPSAPAGKPRARYLRLREFEIVIFIVLAVLLALCLCAAPLVGGAPRGGAPCRAADAPETG